MWLGGKTFKLITIASCANGHDRGSHSESVQHFFTFSGILLKIIINISSLTFRIYIFNFIDLYYYLTMLLQIIRTE